MEEEETEEIQGVNEVMPEDLTDMRAHVGDPYDVHFDKWLYTNDNNW